LNFIERVRTLFNSDAFPIAQHVREFGLPCFQDFFVLVDVGLRHGCFSF
jgi:hypothetical protein